MYDMEVEVKGHTLNVEFDITNISVSNDGIGHYEYWGAKCFDRGQDYVEEFDIFNLTVYSEKRNKYVKVSKALTSAIESIIYADDAFAIKLMEEITEQNYREEAEYRMSFPDESIFD